VYPPDVREDRRHLDHAGLLGHWRNTDGTAGGVRWLVVTDHHGRLRVRALTAGRPEPHDLGTTDVREYSPAPTEHVAWAFTGAFDTGPHSMRLAGYLRSGLLVLTTYHAFAGSAGPAPYWLREFFHRHPGPVPPSRPDRRPADALADRAAAPPGPWELDPGPLVGMWRNVDAGAGRLSAVRIAERDGYLMVRPHGVWAPRRHDWHRTVGSLFTDDPRSGVAAAFTAVFEPAVGWVEMVGHLDRRLLTIETATVFTDGSGRAPFYVREHFYPS
jgi:hypothetical protein